ncbi:MAG: hypothetical protein K2I26_09955 [Paramuribaculum sp.]|nr:hypothetical protein [Paramuribaculum sp.]
MKKIYSLALATICALSASAFGPAQTILPQVAKDLKKANLENAATLEESKLLTPLRVTAADYVGTYDWNYTSGFDGKSYTGSAVIEQGEASGSLIISMATADGTSIVVSGTVNSLTGKLTIPQAKVGTNESTNEDINFYGVTISGQTATKVTVTASYDETNKSITFDSNIVFFVATESGLAELRGYVAAMRNSFVQPTSWETLGTGKFKETFLATMYGIPVSSCPEVDVTVLYNPDQDGMFRIVDPYAEVFGANSTIEIDATDPEYVLIPQQSIGFIDENDGETYIMSRSYAYAFLLSNGLDRDAFIEQQGAYNMTYDKANGRINMPANSFFARWPQASGAAGATNPNSLYSNNNSSESYLILPTDPAAIGNIAADADINAPVEYFNLQGMKIENPEAGQIVIRRQGSTVTKMLTR